jgi:hypothetical protein
MDADEDPSALSTRQLLARILDEGKALVRQEIELGRAELAADLHAEARAARALGAGAVLGIAGLTLALVTAVLGLATILPGWIAGAMVTAVVLALAVVAAAIGWRRRVRRPLDRTRKQIKEDMQWMKDRVS